MAESDVTSGRRSRGVKIAIICLRKAKIWRQRDEKQAMMYHNYQQKSDVLDCWLEFRKLFKGQNLVLT